jgi:hypothetical protein
MDLQPGHQARPARLAPPLHRLAGMLAGVLIVVALFGSSLLAGLH